MSRAANRGLTGRSVPVFIALSGIMILVPLLPALPGAWCMAALIVVAAVMISLDALRLPGFLLLALACCLLAYQSRLNDRLPQSLAATVQDVEGTVSSVPRDYGDSLRFRFEPRPGQGSALPETLLVSWYRDFPEVMIGQAWRLELRLKPPWGSVNFSGPDRERWLFSEGIGGYGSVRGGELLRSPVGGAYPVQAVRGKVQAAISGQIGSERERGVVQALATADRSGVQRADNDLLRVTGTAHLLAISGLHVGLAAVAGVLLARCLAWLLPLARLGRFPFYLAYAGGALAATAYALLANLGVSTVRAVLMLATTFLALAAARSIHPFQAYLLALVLVLTVNPFAPLGSGFWFSFMAVFALLFLFQPRHGARSRWRAVLAAQASVFLVLLPTNAAWLGGFSLTSFPANLLAIPWVSFFVVPPVLLGVVAAAFSEATAGVAWSFAGLMANGLFLLLEWFASLQPWLLAVRPLPLPFLAAAFLGAVLLLTPRGFPARWYGVFLLLPLVMPPRPPAVEDELRVDALDVGQGTAVAVSTANHTLLYDTGPGDGAGIDRVASTITPLFAALGRASPDRVVVSHGDLDHTGGLGSVIERFPGVEVLGSSNDPGWGLEKCTTAAGWRWDGLDFRVLHPSPGLPYLKNNSSCVLAIGDQDVGILLPGDIEDFVEERLLLENLSSFPLMLAPHHGSLSSSGAGFIERIAPLAVIAPAGLGNRFGFPRDAVRDRYTARGARFWSTGACGGLRVTVSPGAGIIAASARRVRARIWRWPLGQNCP